MNFLGIIQAANWNFSLENYDSVWKLLVQFGLLMIALLLGNILRNIVPFLKKGLVPSALIGGLLLFLFNLFLKIFDIELVDKSMMQVITYHGLGIGFVAMTLKTVRVKNKVGKEKIFENGAMTGGAYMLQAFVGLAITIIFYLFTKNTNNPIYYTSGLILALGFGQGPGNALTWDITFSNILDESGNHIFTGGGSFGLTIASIGFVVASVFGIIYINYYKKKGQIKISDSKPVVSKQVLDFEGENEIQDSESVDKFSLQIGFVSLAYAIAFGIMCFFAKISDFTGNIAWGFNFIWGVLAATLIKLILKFLKKKKIVKRNYINNYQMDRISGFAFDLMIVAGVAAIEIEDVKRYIWPLIILCAVGAIVTFIYLKIVTKHCFEGYEHEMFVTNFGTVTGTASNGMILLKEIDPDFVTPASNLFILSQFPAMVFVAPLLLLLNFASMSFKNAIIAFFVFFILWLLYTLFLFRKKIFKKQYLKTKKEK